jgi:hypothetical protein
MIRVNFSKKLLFYSKQTLQHKENRINKLKSVYLADNVLNSYGMGMQSKNRFFHSDFVNTMIQGMAQ